MTKEQINDITMKMIAEEVAEIYDLVTRDEKTIIASLCRVSAYIDLAAALKEELIEHDWKMQS